MTNDAAKAAREYLTARRKRFAEEILTMQGRMKELDSLLSELDAPIASVKKQFAPVASTAAKGSTQSEALLNALERAGQAGATYKMVTEYFHHNGFPDAKSSAVSARLSTLKAQGRAVYSDGRYILKSAINGHA